MPCNNSPCSGGRKAKDPTPKLVLEPKSTVAPPSPATASATRSADLKFESLMATKAFARLGATKQERTALKALDLVLNCTLIPLLTVLLGFLVLVVVRIVTMGHAYFTDLLPQKTVEDPDAPPRNRIQITIDTIMAKWEHRDVNTHMEPPKSTKSFYKVYAPQSIIDLLNEGKLLWRLIVLLILPSLWLTAVLDSAYVLAPRVIRMDKDECERLKVEDEKLKEQLEKLETKIENKENGILEELEKDGWDVLPGEENGKIGEDLADAVSI